MAKLTKSYGILLGLLAASISLPTAYFNIVFATSLLFSIMISSKAELIELFKNRMLWILWGSFLLLLTGLLYTQTENLSEGLDLCSRRLPFVFTPILFAHKEQYFFKMISYGFMSGVLLGFMICLLNVVQTPGVYGHIEQIYISNWYWSDILLEPIDKHRSYYSFYAVFSFFLALHFIFGSRTKLEKALLGIGLLLFSGIILSLEARIFIILFPFMILVYFLLKMRSIKIAALITIVVAFTGIVFFMLHPARFHNIRILKIDTDSNVRITIYENTWEVIKENWIWGTGTGDFHQALIERYKVNQFEAGENILYNAHNQYLEEWARGGILSISALVLLLGYALFLGYRRNPLFPVFICCAAIFFMVESVLNRQQGISFFILFLCVFSFGLENTSIKSHFDDDDLKIKLPS